MENEARPPRTAFQTWSRASLWIGIATVIYSFADWATPLRHPEYWEIHNCALLFPAIFINQRLYQAPAVLLFCINAAAVYVTLLQ
jgi:hypothetical protein